MGKTSNKNIKKTIIKTNNSLPINLKRTLWEGHQIKTLQWLIITTNILVSINLERTLWGRDQNKNNIFIAIKLGFHDNLRNSPYWTKANSNPHS